MHEVGLSFWTISQSLKCHTCAHLICSTSITEISMESLGIGTSCINNSIRTVEDVRLTRWMSFRGNRRWTRKKKRAWFSNIMMDYIRLHFVLPRPALERFRFISVIEENRGFQLSILFAFVIWKQRHLTMSHKYRHFTICKLRDRFRLYLTF